MHKRLNNLFHKGFIFKDISYIFLCSAYHHASNVRSKRMDYYADSSGVSITHRQSCFHISIRPLHFTLNDTALLQSLIAWNCINIFQMAVTLFLFVNRNIFLK